jgi:hypothetical protein
MRIQIVASTRKIYRTNVQPVYNLPTYVVPYNASAVNNYNATSSCFFFVCKRSILCNTYNVGVIVVNLEVVGLIS